MRSTGGPQTTKDTQLKTKSVDWSYPGSETAKRFGYDTEGCWTVMLHGTELERVAAFRRPDHAVDHAVSLPHAWNKFFLRFMAAEIRLMFYEKGII